MKKFINIVIVFIIPVYLDVRLTIFVMFRAERLRPRLRLS